MIGFNSIKFNDFIIRHLRDEFSFIKE